MGRKRIEKILITRRNILKFDKSRMLDCFSDHQSEMDQGIIEFLLINQEPKLLKDDEKNLGKTPNSESLKS